MSENQEGTICGKHDDLKGRCVFVTGGTGAIGPALVSELLQRSAKVRLLIVDDKERVALPPGVVAVKGDISDRSSLTGAMGEADIVFHLAAKLHINDPSPELKKEYVRINVDGTRNVAEAAGAAGVTRFVHFSTICVYGASTIPELLNESSPINCPTLYSETKAASERIVLDLVPGVVLRMAAIYGPTMKGNYARLIEAIRRRRFVFIGRGNNRRTLVYLDDAVRAAILAATHSGASGRVFNVSDGHVHTMNDILSAMNAALRRNPHPGLRIPRSLAVGSAVIGDIGLRCLGMRVKLQPIVEKFLEDMAVDASKIMQELGFQPQVDLLEGWRRTQQCI